MHFPAAVVVALVLTVRTADAQTIRGRVVEERRNAAIPAASVAARSADGRTVATAVSDSAGRFELHLGTPGRYYLHVTHTAFATPGPLLVPVARAETVEVELRLATAAVPLRPLIVTSVRDPRLAGFYERMRTAFSGQFLTRADIDTRPGARTTDLMREMTGLDIVGTGGTLSRPRSNFITMRSGLGVCTPSVYIDGLYVRQMPDSSLDDFLKPEMLEGVEVYTNASSAPSSLDARSACGVVAFWTRPVGDVERFSLRRLVMLGAAVSAMALMVILSQ